MYIYVKCLSKQALIVSGLIVEVKHNVDPNVIN